jgi:orotate phosphoribosyltransferase
MTQDGLIGSTVMRRGHFLLESGHHGDLWLDLELLCLRPRQIEGSVAALSRPYGGCRLRPLNEGAFVALMVASQLDVEFYYAERFERAPSDQLFPVEYRLPSVLRSSVQGKRVAIVNDVINAGSAVRAPTPTFWPAMLSPSPWPRFSFWANRLGALPRRRTFP